MSGEGASVADLRKGACGCGRSRIFTAMMDFMMGHGAGGLLRMAFAAMLAVLFLQSSLDKLFHWKGEKDFLAGHFAKSILKGTVPLLLPVITLIELGAGCCSAIGFFSVLFRHGSGIGLLGMLLGTKAIVLLFFGQRVAKDYAGAASLVPYFLLCAGGLYVFMAV